ncbi:hypothetical protein JL722_7355 [Aureococcus anophagefferens]|nr:hypothetical protein JL722_7355 [Aureococcus anophagefferens]
MAAALDMKAVCASLVSILHRGDPFSKLEAARALCNMTVKDDHLSAVAAAGAIPPLVVLLRSGDDSVKLLAAKVLQNLARGVWEIRNSIGAAGAVPALIEVVNSGDDSSKKHAAHALANLAWHHDGNTLSVASAIVPLVQLLRDGSDDAKEAAAQALSNLAWFSENHVAIAVAGAIPLLVAAETGSHAGAILKKNAAFALNNLTCGNIDNTIAVIEARGAKALVRITRPGVTFFATYNPGGPSQMKLFARNKELTARELAKRRVVMIRKILEHALPPEIAASVVAPFLGRWGAS